MDLDDAVKILCQSTGDVHSPLSSLSTDLDSEKTQEEDTEVKLSPFQSFTRQLSHEHRSRQQVIYLNL